MIRALEPFTGYDRPAHHARPKLTPEQRERIAYLRGDGETPRDLAEAFGVSTAVIKRIAVRERT